MLTVAGLDAYGRGYVGGRRTVTFCSRVPEDAAPAGVPDTAWYLRARFIRAPTIHLEYAVIHTAPIALAR